MTPGLTGCGGIAVDVCDAVDGVDVGGDVGWEGRLLATGLGVEDAFVDTMGVGVAVLGDIRYRSKALQLRPQTILVFSLRSGTCGGKVECNLWVRHEKSLEVLFDSQLVNLRIWDTVELTSHISFRELRQNHWVPG